MDDRLVARDRVDLDLVARSLGARDGAPQCVVADGAGHVGVALRALAVVLEGRRVVAAGRPQTLVVDVGERWDGVRVVGYRDGRGWRSVVCGCRRRVPGGTDVGVALGSRGGVRRVVAREHDDRHDCGDYDGEHTEAPQKLHLSYS